MSVRLIQLSGVIIDMIYSVDAVPAPGTEAVVHGSAIAAGGGFNAMVAARRAGLDVDYGGTLGSGAFAGIAEAALKDEGIGILRPRLEGLDQGCCTVLIDRDGERSFIASSRADGVVTDADLARIDPGAGDWLLLSGYALHYKGSREALTRWLQAQAGRGLDLVFDPCPLVAELPAAAVPAALGAAAWVTANAEEARVLTGLAGPAEAACKLAEGRKGGALVRAGAAGCWLALPDGVVSHLPGHKVAAVDTNGAGDAHTGTFIALMAQGWAAAEAARAANISAALSTTRRGPSTAPAWDEVQSVLERAEAPA